MSNQEVQQVAQFHVFERNLYQMPQRQPLANGILDQRLVSWGPQAAAWRLSHPSAANREPRTRRASARRARGSWQTAAATTVRCAAGLSWRRLTGSPPGYIHLELPIFHIGYFKNTIAILQCVCKTCARVMVPEDERRQHLRRLRSRRTDVRPACCLDVGDGLTCPSPTRR